MRNPIMSAASSGNSAPFLPLESLYFAHGFRQIGPGTRCNSYQRSGQKAFSRNVHQQISFSSLQSLLDGIPPPKQGDYTTEQNQRRDNHGKNQATINTNFRHSACRSGRGSDIMRAWRKTYYNGGRFAR